MRKFFVGLLSCVVMTACVPLLLKPLSNTECFNLSLQGKVILPACHYSEKAVSDGAAAFKLKKMMIAFQNDIDRANQQIALNQSKFDNLQSGNVQSPNNNSAPELSTSESDQWDLKIIFYKSTLENLTNDYNALIANYPVN